MNIFFLDRDPRLAAEYHIDKHVVKMVTEYAQILGTVVRLTSVDSKPGRIWKKRKGELVEVDYEWTLPSDDINGKGSRGVPLVTHKNHPSVKWTMKNNDNLSYLWHLYEALNDVYVYRYKTSRGLEWKDHGAWANYNTSIKYFLRPRINQGDHRNIEVAEEYQAMPVEYKNKDFVKAYRDYILNGKNPDMLLWEGGKTCPFDYRTL